ncbi:MAG: hypothetical protein M0P77_05760 [Firmicutes bacterium]|nr:hypothetical protein [Bacillota bacterium]
MNIKHPYYIIVNSKGIKTYFYYKDSAIYYNSTDTDYSKIEKILVNKVSENFICTVSENDTICILCEALSKDILLFINDGSGWHMNKIPVFTNISHVFLIDMFFIKDNFNILFYGKMPLIDYFTIFHAIRKKDRWEIINVCKIFSTEVNRESFKILVKNDIINLICTSNNNNQIVLKHYIYDSSIEKWYENRIINIYCNNSLKIKMQAVYNEVYLVCFFIENNNLTFLIFKKNNDLKSPFSLLDSSKITISNNIGLFYFDLKDYVLKITSITDYKMQSWNYDLQSKDLLSETKLSHNYSIAELRYIELVKNLGKGELIKEEKIFIINDNFEVKEFQFSITNTTSLSDNKLYAFGKESGNQTDCIINRIDFLSEKISNLDNKLMKLIDVEPKVNYYKNCKHNNQTYSIIERKVPLNDSRFKEKFMKSKPGTFKLNDGVLLKGKFSDHIISDEKKSMGLSENNDKTGSEAVKVEAVINEKNRFLKVIESLFK